MITDFDGLLEAVREHPRQTVAVAAAESPVVLEAIRDARERGLVDAVLVGDMDRVQAAAQEVGLGEEGISIIHAPDDLTAARAACDAVRDGRAHMLMKGHMHTDDLLRAVLDKEHGLRAGTIMSHVFALETRNRGKLTLVTDGAMNIAPDLVLKADIIMNAVYLASALGNCCPKVGILAAVELINPKMPATLDAAALASMEHRGQFPTCIVDGPFALDNAISPEAARVKGIPGDVAGDCDILVAPTVEAGNILAKSFAFLAGGRLAGVLVGAAAPVVLTSRADNAEARMLSIALGVLMAGMKRAGRLKVGRVHF